MPSQSNACGHRCCAHSTAHRSETGKAAPNCANRPQHLESGASRHRSRSGPHGPTASMRDHAPADIASGNSIARGVAAITIAPIAVLIMLASPPNPARHHKPEQRLAWAGPASIAAHHSKHNARHADSAQPDVVLQGTAVRVNSLWRARRHRVQVRPLVVFLSKN